MNILIYKIKQIKKMQNKIYLIFFIINVYVNISKQQNPTLINSWLFNGDYSDSVRGANIIGGVNKR